MPVRSRPRAARAAKWLLILGVIWAGQLIWLHHRLGRPTWGEYWHLRGLYRPGIQAVDATGGDYLPGHVFHPLSPAGAKWAFVLAAGVYAAAVTLLAWAVWRWNRRRGRARYRPFRRATA